MKLNRRSFFGAAAAAPVAAKQAVSSVLEYERTAGAGMLNVAASVPNGIYPGMSEDYLKDELKSLISRKANVSKSDYGEDYRRDLAALIQIDNRRATSPAVKALLIAEERARRDKARELSYIDRQIAQIKEKLGPLGVMFD